MSQINELIAAAHKRTLASILGQQKITADDDDDAGQTDTDDEVQIITGFVSPQKRREQFQIAETGAVLPREKKMKSNEAIFAPEGQRIALLTNWQIKKQNLLSQYPPKVYYQCRNPTIGRYQTKTSKCTPVMLQNYTSEEDYNTFFTNEQECEQNTKCTDRDLTAQELAELRSRFAPNPVYNRPKPPLRATASATAASALTSFATKPPLRRTTRETAQKTIKNIKATNRVLAQTKPGKQITVYPGYFVPEIYKGNYQLYKRIDER